MTAHETQMMDHLRANHRAGCDLAEIKRQAEWYAQTNPYQSSRLPELLAGAIRDAKKKEKTA